MGKKIKYMEMNWYYWHCQDKEWNDGKIMALEIVSDDKTEKNY